MTRTLFCSCCTQLARELPLQVGSWVVRPDPGGSPCSDPELSPQHHSRHSQGAASAGTGLPCHRGSGAVVMCVVPRVVVVMCTGRAGLIPHHQPSSPDWTSGFCPMEIKMTSSLSLCWAMHLPGEMLRLRSGVGVCVHAELFPPGDCADAGLPGLVDTASLAGGLRSVGVSPVQ